MGEIANSYFSEVSEVDCVGEGGGVPGEDVVVVRRSAHCINGETVAAQGVGPRPRRFRRAHGIPHFCVHRRRSDLRLRQLLAALARPEGDIGGDSAGKQVSHLHDHADAPARGKGPISLRETSFRCLATDQ